MTTILIIAGISGILALALIKYVNFRTKKRERKPDLTIGTLKTKYSTLEYQLASLISDHRGNLYLKDARLTDTISTVCREHSLYMAKNGKADHLNAILRTNKLRKALNIKHSSEVIAFGQGTAAGILKMWLKSPSHKKAIEGNWTKFGLSIERKKRNYTTCIFTK